MSVMKSAEDEDVHVIEPIRLVEAKRWHASSHNPDVVTPSTIACAAFIENSQRCRDFVPHKMDSFNVMN
ncbi:hypothetical protein ONE63_011521 [Megalurothrips usitatus]|uniref:Uncharacterized protein n=1 Tax=Megalurothrips usitatus TaxID=439358 RepID=A0AAV7WZ38_9NEOP|nr:hypothetical protein ONE63_011521 [Megalurothrips usitatus]